jgi:hypothetical protein
VSGNNADTNGYPDVDTNRDANGDANIYANRNADRDTGNDSYSVSRRPGRGHVFDRYVGRQ